MVVGAGRGPLVRAALTAAKTAQRRVRVFAVEKNPNAVVTLQQQKIELWGDQVSNIWKTFGFLVHLQYKYILVPYVSIIQYWVHFSSSQAPRLWRPEKGRDALILILKVH